MSLRRFSQASRPEAWGAQKKLAQAVTGQIHNESGLESALHCTDALYRNSIDSLASLSLCRFEAVFGETPSHVLKFNPALTVHELMLCVSCFSSAKSAEHAIRAGRFYVNNV